MWTDIQDVEIKNYDPANRVDITYDVHAFDDVKKFISDWMIALKANLIVDNEFSMSMLMLLRYLVFYGFYNYRYTKFP